MVIIPETQFAILKAKMAARIATSAAYATVDDDYVGNVAACAHDIAHNILIFCGIKSDLPFDPEKAPVVGIDRGTAGS